MSVLEIGSMLVDLCRQGKNMEAIETLYSPDIVSVEPMAMSGMERTQRGIEAIKGKNQWWFANHEMHNGEVRGPFPHGDRFAVLFAYDVTQKQTGQQVRMEEVAVYTVDNGKIVKEEFFYAVSH